MTLAITTLLAVLKSISTGVPLCVNMAILVKNQHRNPWKCAICPCPSDPSEFCSTEGCDDDPLFYRIFALCEGDMSAVLAVSRGGGEQKTLMAKCNIFPYVQRENTSNCARPDTYG